MPKIKYTWSLILFVTGLMILSMVPFLTWFNYGSYNLDYPPQVSLIWLFEHRFVADLAFYLTGVALSVVLALANRRPIFFQGILPAIFPAFSMLAAMSVSFENHFPGYLQVLSFGIFFAFLGSALLEASYFSYRYEDSKSQQKLLRQHPHPARMN